MELLGKDVSMRDAEGAVYWIETGREGDRLAQNDPGICRTTPDTGRDVTTYSRGMLRGVKIAA
jgi:hypothetical protein